MAGRQAATETSHGGRIDLFPGGVSSSHVSFICHLRRHGRHREGRRRFRVRALPCSVLFAGKSMSCQLLHAMPAKACLPGAFSEQVVYRHVLKVCHVVPKKLFCGRRVHLHRMIKMIHTLYMICFGEGEERLICPKEPGSGRQA